jgi:hypothetical protein
MRFLKRSTRHKPVLSLILLDWSVRESFHLLHYLGRQSVDRDQFEVIFIEYYSRVAEPLKQFAEQVDTWVLLEMPESCIYHKHLMYNCGLAFTRGDIIVLCDSDAMVKRSFIETIIRHFNDNQRTVLHLDQFRNMRRDLYPFHYPTFDEVIGAGCFNHVEGKTSGIVDRVDPLHSRNYGACMCARRGDLIDIGGADEHIDYLGHICGPYEMTLRLLNRGFEEVWHETEYLYHTWHPGQAGVDNYQGPHDGRQMSSTALEAVITGRIFPLVENKCIGLLRNGPPSSELPIEEQLVDRSHFASWDRSKIAAQNRDVRAVKALTDIYRGFGIRKDGEYFHACPLLDKVRDNSLEATALRNLESKSVESLREKIDQQYPSCLRLAEWINHVCSQLWLIVWALAVPLLGIAKLVLMRAGSGEGAVAKISIDQRRLGAKGLARLRQYGDKYRVSWLAIKHYRSYMDQWTNNLTANLYFAQPRMFPPVVLTSSLFTQIYLRGLSVLGILPWLKIKRLKKKAKIQLYLEQFAREDYPETLIVARDIYTNNYGLIKSCSGSKQILVV